MFVQLFDRVVGGNKVIEHGAGRREDARHKVQNLTHLADVLQYERKAGSIRPAEEGECFF